MGTMGLIKDTKQVEESPLVPVKFTNAICYGKTGSGKTSGFILPNIENRIKKNHGILVYDFKGNTHELVKRIAKKQKKLDKVIEIGTPWGEKTNIIQNLDSRTLRDVFVNMHGSSNDRYWQNSAANLFSAVYKIQLNLQQVGSLEGLMMQNDELMIDLLYVHKQIEVSLRSIFKSINSVKSLKKFFTDVEADMQVIDKNIELMVQYSYDEAIARQLAHHLEKIKEGINEIKPYEKLNETSDSISGLYGVIDVAQSTLSNAAMNEYINENSFDIVQSLRQGHIVVVHLGNLDQNLMGAFNLCVYKSLQSGLNNKGCAVSIFIDEAQKVLHPNYLPDVDVCRESKFEYIFATQDELLLHNAIGHNKTEMLLRNIVEQYSFSSNNIDNGTHTLKMFEYENLMTGKKRYAKPLFFKPKELFDAEYEYQTLKNIRQLIDKKYLENMEIEEPCIVLNSPELYERNEVRIKTSTQNIYTTRLVGANDSILDEYKKRVAKSNDDSISMDFLYDLYEDTKKDKPRKKTTSAASNRLQTAAANRLQTLEVLYKKTDARLIELENDSEYYKRRTREYFQKTKRMESILKRIIDKNNKDVAWV